MPERINPSIFKAYDIRGIYPNELNEEVARKIGQTFIAYTGAKKVVVGRDTRLSSPQLFKALTEGIVEQGADVFDIGLISIDCLYFSVGHYGFDGGIMITASHNPKQWNGFKIVDKKVEVIPGEKIGQEIEKSKFLEVKQRGEVKEKNIWEDYLSHILSFVDVKKIKPFKVVVDASNAMAGKVIPFLQSKLPIKVIPLNFELNGNFPAHPPNPLLEGVSDQIGERIEKEEADFGFIFDGDADRIFLIDEIGNFIRADVTLLLLAKYFLKKNPGAGIAYNLICSKAVPEFIQKWGGRPLRTAVGFINVQNALKKNNCIMGGELSSHYCFRDNFYSDSGFITFLTLLQVISEENKKVSELVAPLSPFTKSAEINFEVEQKEAMLNKIKEKYSDGKQDYLDGVTVEYNNWWFNLRPSHTENLLRLTVEAKTKSLMQEKLKEITRIIKKTA